MKVLSQEPLYNKTFEGEWPISIKVFSSTDKTSDDKITVGFNKVWLVSQTFIFMSIKIFVDCNCICWRKS